MAKKKKELDRRVFKKEVLDTSEGWTEITFKFIGERA